MEKLVFDRSVTNALKIAAAICVAIFHHSYCVWCGTIEVFSFSYAATSKLASWGIAIFFFFSGYGLMESEQRKPLGTFGCFMRRRILKIYVPVLLVTLLWLPLYLPEVAGTPETWEQVAGYIGRGVSTLFWKWGDSALWFIRSLLQLYLVFFFFTKLLRKNKQAAAWALMVGGTLAIYLMKCTSNEYQAISIPLFGIGAFASYYKHKIVRRLHLSLLPLAACCALSALLHGDSGITALLLQNYGFVGIMIFVCSNFELKLPKVPLLGDLSFDIYLVHNKILEYTFRFQGCGLPLGWFAALTLVFSGAFYLLRTRVMKLSRFS